MTGSDLRAFLRGAMVWLPVGVAAMAAGLLPHSALPLPWPVRLLIGASGALLCALSLPAAWRWVLNGGDKDAS